MLCLAARTNKNTFTAKTIYLYIVSNKQASKQRVRGEVKMAKIVADNDEKLVARLAPLIEERIRYRIVQSIIEVLEEQLYPPEEMFREAFIKRVEDAEKEINKGRIWIS